ncbi:MAG TPA: HAD-IC family P-type ATPase [Gaiellaceae bacterium]|nr:HAD-IC family P-type ATPase [Gaiellaceae bacterium]
MSQGTEGYDDGALSIAETAPVAGLSEPEASRRREARGAAPTDAASRSYGSIVRANVLTVFNLILVVAGGLTLAFGAWQDALFLAILVANSAIGIGQEVRAKRTLDRLAALVAPQATVIRDGRPRRVHADDVVEGDLVELQAGDQLVADGKLVGAAGLALDESNLTGESRPVARAAGEEVRSGSFAVEGSGRYLVSAVGAESYAGRVAGEAREFRHPRSPLERALNRLLFALVAAMIPLGAILGVSLFEQGTSFRHAVPTAVAAVVTLVPEGLILLTSLTFAVAAMRMARLGALAQQLNAVESVASVDVVCIDKTGTLTDARLRVVEAAPPASGAAFARYAAAAGSRNATIAALAEAFPGEAEDARDEVPFSSGRKWSALELADGTVYVLGAPELVAPALDAGPARAIGLARARVLPDPELPLPPLEPVGVVRLAESLRPDAHETVRFLREQGVELRILSGDRAEAVAAVAAELGIDRYEARVTPADKKRIVEELTREGRYVAMVGDGVNDVPALKAARLAIAQGSGAQMAKSVSDLVLVHGEFGAVPALVHEGRKVLRNLQRVAKLFVAKSTFAAFLILSIGLTPTAYPLLPRHLSLAAGLTIGVPAFFLALAPSGGDWRTRGFLREVSRFAVPAGTAAGLGVLASYLFSLNVVGLRLVESRTVAETVLVAVGLYLVLALEASGRTRGIAVAVLCASMAALYGLSLALSSTRAFFALTVPGAAAIAVAVVGIAIAIGGLVLTDERFVPGRGRGRATA